MQYTITINQHMPVMAANAKSVLFGMFSLFPPTYKNRSVAPPFLRWMIRLTRTPSLMYRENGMRIDLAETFAACKPTVFRFPGGDDLE